MKSRKKINFFLRKAAKKNLDPNFGQIFAKKTTPNCPPPPAVFYVRRALPCLLFISVFLCMFALGETAMIQLVVVL